MRKTGEERGKDRLSPVPSRLVHSGSSPTKCRSLLKTEKDLLTPPFFRKTKTQGSTTVEKSPSVSLV